MDQWLYNISIGCWAAVSELHLVPAAAAPPLSPPYPSPFVVCVGVALLQFSFSSDILISVPSALFPSLRSVLQRLSPTM